MSQNLLSKLVDRIYKSNDTEIECIELQNTLPAYVDVEIEDPSKTTQYPQVRAHLDQCPDCMDEYRALREVAALEAENALPDAESLLDQIEEGEAEKETTDQLPLPTR